MEHMRNELSIAAGDRFRLVPPTAIVCLLLIFAQLALLAHIDDIDKAESVEECELCLLLNAGDDFIEAGAASDIIAAAPSQRPDHSAVSPTGSSPVPQARSPPQA